MLHAARWTVKKAAQRLHLIQPMIHRRRVALPPFRYLKIESPQAPAPLGLDADDSAWQVIEPNTYWGAWRTNYVLRARFRVPDGWGRERPLALYLPLGESGDFSHPEALAHIDGEEVAACDRHHQEFRIDSRWNDGQEHVLALKGWTGIGGSHDGFYGQMQLLMRPCFLVEVDEPTRQFISAARVAVGVVRQLDEDDPAKGRLLNALDDAFQVLDTRDPLGDAFYDSVPAAMQTLRLGIASAGAPLDVDVIGMGHAHIDVAWLWSLAQTREKAARSFTTVLRLMEDFPDYHFTQSQPQLYQYVEQDHPQLFEGIRQRVAEGRWELLGGAWVEPDCNASGAEALARQFLLGRRYFESRFGPVETPVFWLPDTFGYPWALPQLIRLAGLEYFITHKISWNQYNRMPYQSFWWQGVDGTKVLTHFITTPAEFPEPGLPYSTTYNGALTPFEMIGTWRNYVQKEQHSELLTAYGYGDGGGGPTREMLEDSRTLASIAGSPRLRLGTVREFMAGLEQDAARFPTWNGELYLEYHRGTFTSQARNKRNNRKSEFALHDAEFLAALASLTTGAAYPRDELNLAWELVCLNQFHDILPGSSIGEVYVDSARDYAQIQRIAAGVLDAAVQNLAAATPAGTTFIAINPTSFAGTRFALLDAALDAGTSLTTASGASLLAQPVEGGTLVELPDAPAYSVTPIQVQARSAGYRAASDTASATTEGGTTVLENGLLRVEIDGGGELTRVFDKAARRDVLSGGRGNILQAFEDRPLNYDAWDIDIFYDDKMWTPDPAAEVAIIEQGPLRAGVEIRRALFHSQIVQRIYLYRGRARLDFDTWVDWREHHVLLKVAFPVNVFNPAATYEIQWGNIERPTHRNTSWDWARFEVCGYKWVDLSEGDYGVSLLNDCKYGHDVQDNVLRLTLLKGATSPDPDADQGEHRFTYSLLPHSGSWRGVTAAEAYDLNDPVLIRRVNPGPGTTTGSVISSDSLVRVDSPNVIIETVKQAEDGNGLIVRLYESERRRGSVTLQTGFALQSASVCNLLERDETALDIGGDGRGVTFDILPYQIRSFRLVPA